MRINETALAINKMAVEKGWYDTPRSALEIHMLIVSEIAEATEEVRKGRPACYWEKDKNLVDKPEGEAIELADAVIRIMDTFVANGWDLEEAIKRKMEYNAQRPYRHGGKKA